jgi:hypothetical protein
MSSVVDLVEPTHLDHLATPANLRLGRAIAGQGGVEIVEFGTCRVTARVSNGQRRSVELNSTPQGLEWHCTCTRRPGPLLQALRGRGRGDLGRSAAARAAERRRVASKPREDDLL